MNRWLLSLMLIVIATSAFAQPDTLWTRTYGGIFGDVAHDVQITTDGGYIVAGSTWSFGAGGLDFYLVKTDEQGDTLWTRTFGGNSHEECYSVQQTSDGGYIAAGYTQTFGSGGYDGYLVKTDEQGDTLWTRASGGGHDDLFTSVAVTSDGGYVAAGYMGFLSGGLQFWLAKFDSEGDSLWARTYGGSGDDWAWSVQQTTDGGFVMAGITHSFGESNGGCYLVKTDSEGDTLWTRVYGGGLTDGALSMRQASDGGYLVAGFTASSGAGLSDCFLLRTNSEGDTHWTHTYGGTENDWASSGLQTPQGDHVLVGVTTSFGAGGRDVYLAMTNAFGETMWTRTFGGNVGDEARSFQQTPDGGFIIAGNTASFGAGSDDFYLLRVASEESADETITPQPFSFALSSYPNPFNPTTTITFSLPQTERVTLVVYDITGREIRTLVDRAYSAGEYHTTFDGADLPSGIYLARLTAGEQQVTQKLLLVR